MENLINFKSLDEITKAGARGYSIWLIDTKGISAIYRNGTLNYLKELGFYKKKYTTDNYLFYRKEAHVLTRYTVLEVREFVFNTIFDSEYDIQIDFGSTITVIKSELLKEVFRKNQDSIFNHNFLTGLEDISFNICRDNRKEAFIPFRNTVVKVTQDEVEVIAYDKFHNQVFYSTQIIQHDFTYSEDWKLSKFGAFIRNVTNNILERKNSMRSAIGYLLHRYNDISTSQAVLLYDESMSEKSKPEGGTGKGVFTQAIKAVVKGFVSINGKSIKPTSQFGYSGHVDPFLAILTP